MNENKFRARGILKTDLIEELWPNCSEVTARLAFTESDGTESNYPLILDEDLAKQYEGYAVDVEGYVQPLPCRDYTGKEVRALVVTSIVPLSNQPVYTKNEHDTETGFGVLPYLLLVGWLLLYALYHTDFFTDYPTITGKFYSYDGNTIERSYTFLYHGRICKVTVNIPSGLYDEARFTEKHAVRECYLGVCSDVNWTKYWINLTLSPAEKPIIMNIVNQLRACAKNDNEFVEAASIFVQSIDYDWNKFFTPLAEGTRFPVETLVDGRGVCGDKALLLAAILHYAGFETALLRYKQENHMAVGVKCTCPNIGEYCFIEPTHPYPIGYIPKGYVGGVKLVSFPEVHRLPKSEGKYYTCSKMGGAALSEIKQNIIDVLRREFSLAYRPELDSAIARNVLPYGYTGGLTWTFELPKGSPSFVIARFYKCYIQDRCGYVSTNSGFVQDARTSKYFGVAVYDNGTEYTLKILLAD